MSLTLDGTYPLNVVLFSRSKRPFYWSHRRSNPTNVIHISRSIQPNAFDMLYYQATKQMKFRRQLLIYRKKKVIKKHMLQVIFICNFFLLFFPFLFHFLSRCSSLVLHAHFPSLHLRALTKKNSRIIITSRTHHSRICVFNVFSMICIVDGNIFFFFVIM